MTSTPWHLRCRPGPRAGPSGSIVVRGPVVGLTDDHVRGEAADEREAHRVTVALATTRAVRGWAYLAIQGTRTARCGRSHGLRQAVRDGGGCLPAVRSPGPLWHAYLALTPPWRMLRPVGLGCSREHATRHIPDDCNWSFVAEVFSRAAGPGRPVLVDAENVDDALGADEEVDAGAEEPVAGRTPDDRLPSVRGGPFARRHARRVSCRCLTPVGRCGQFLGMRRSAVRGQLSLFTDEGAQAAGVPARARARQSGRWTWPQDSPLPGEVMAADRY
jgi:hypothetical protein